MAQRIDQSEVKKVAKLARLDLTEKEVEEFTSQLSAILDYVAKMNELDTENVEPLAHCLLSATFSVRILLSLRSEQKRPLPTPPKGTMNFSKYLKYSMTLLEHKIK